MPVSSWSTTAASNSSVGSANIAEGSSPGDVNDAIRAVMADVKQYALDGEVSLKVLGAVGDGVADDTAAFTAALSYKAIFIPPGTYNVSSAISPTVNGVVFRGAGIGVTIVRSTSASVPVFSLASNRAWIKISDMTIDRTVTATSGGNGIDTSSYNLTQSEFSGLLIQNQWVGLNLGPTDYTKVENSIIQTCYSDGVKISNTATNGSCQWSFDTVLAQKNAGNGFSVQSVAGPAQVTLGTWVAVATYGNTGKGISIVGTSGVPIQDFRLIQSFIGEDGGSEIYLDTYGRNHEIIGGVVELAGRSPTGRTLATTASGVGSGVEVTANNTNIQINGLLSDGNSYDGFYLSASNQCLAGCTATNNGQAATAGRRNGVNVLAGYCAISGGNFGNTGAGVSQQYGAFHADGTKLARAGGIWAGNSTAEVGATANSASIKSAGTLP